MTNVRWLVAALSGLAMVAVALLPTAPAVRWTPEVKTMRMIAFDLDMRIRIRSWTDSLAPLTVSRPPERPIAGAPPGTDTNQLRHVEEAMARLSGGSPPVHLGRFTVLLDGESHPLRRTYGIWRAVGISSVEIAGRSGSKPYCITVRPVETSRLEYTTSRGLYFDPDEYTDPGRAMMGLCAVVAEHGLPGPAMADLMNRAGPDLGLASGSDMSVTEWADWAEMEQSNAARLFPLFAGIDTRRYLPRDAQSCLAGVEAACARLVTNARVPFPDPAGDGGPRMASTSRYSYMPALPEVVDPAFLARLEEHFGPERFGRFWTSDLDVEPAFEAAFGLPLGRYVMERAHEVYGPVRPGPGVDTGGWWGLLVALALGLGAGAWVGVRRRPA